MDLRAEAGRVPALAHIGAPHLLADLQERPRVPALRPGWALVEHLRVRHAVLDGEVVCLDADGRSRFNHLLFGRAEPLFAVFGLLALDGTDLRDHARASRAVRCLVLA